MVFKASVVIKVKTALPVPTVLAVIKEKMENVAKKAKEEIEETREIAVTRAKKETKVIAE